MLSQAKLASSKPPGRVASQRTGQAGSSYRLISQEMEEDCAQSPSVGSNNGTGLQGPVASRCRPGSRCSSARHCAETEGSLHPSWL